MVDLGWDAATPPNETVDGDGNPLAGPWGFMVPDPTCPAQRRYDDPQVEALRQRLRACNGLPYLEICAPDEVARAAKIFHRDGFVVVRDLLDAAGIARMRAACDRALSELLACPGTGGRRYGGETGRLPHRYSFGTCSASRQMLHDPDWVALIELADPQPLLTAMFGSDDYLVWGSGGDVCLPGAIEYQHLHADAQDTFGLPPERFALAESVAATLGTRLSELPGAHGQRLALELTPPMITINFVLTELTWENGPIRHVPGTHGLGQSPPGPGEEPGWMRTCTLMGAPAGAGVFRDNRAWHGGTPNLGLEARALPNVEYVAPWYPQSGIGRTMPAPLWESLSPAGRRRCRHVALEAGVPVPGGVRLHPWSNRRRQRDGSKVSTV